VANAFAQEWQQLGGGIVLQQKFGSSSELRAGINGGAGIAQARQIHHEGFIKYTQRNFGASIKTAILPLASRKEITCHKNDSYQGINLLIEHIPLKNCTSWSHITLIICVQSKMQAINTTTRMTQRNFFTPLSVYSLYVTRLACVT
jgi:hypothetical protein